MEKIVNKIKDKSIKYSLVTSIDPKDIGLDYSDNLQEVIEYDSQKIYKFSERGFILFYIGTANSDKTKLATRITVSAGIKQIIFIGQGTPANDFSGDGVLINDHINMSGLNPLIGVNDEKYGVRFPDMTDIYSNDMRKKIKKTFSNNNIFIEEGCLLVPQNTTHLTELEKKVLNIERKIKVVSQEIYAGSITGKHANIKSAGIILFNNICLKEIFV